MLRSAAASQLGFLGPRLESSRSAYGNRPAGQAGATLSKEPNSSEAMQGLGKLGTLKSEGSSKRGHEKTNAGRLGFAGMPRALSRVSLIPG